MENKFKMATTSTTSKELSLNEAIQLLLVDDELSDLTLQGNDGNIVKANRCILAARSIIFRKMLYGDFQEATNNVIKINAFTGNVLQALVEYIYTDTSCVLKEKEPTDGMTPETFVHRLLSLAYAAIYFDLSNLLNQTQKVAKDIIRYQPTLACSFLRECRILGPELIKVEEAALNAILNDPIKCLIGIPFLALCPGHMEEIVSSNKIIANEFQIFQLIQKWTGDIIVKENDDNDDDKEETNGDAAIEQSRQSVAKQLITQYIRLDQIHPMDLKSTVGISGLVTDKQYIHALETALENHLKGKTINYNKPRYPKFLWKYANDVLFKKISTVYYSTDIVQCHPIQSGIAKWNIKIEQKDTLGITFGIVRPEWPKYKPIGSHPGSWTWSDGAKYDVGDEISFTLDLRNITNDYNGSLTASVNEGESYVVSTNLCNHIGTTGFVPAATVQSENGVIRLISYEHHKE